MSDLKTLVFTKKAILFDMDGTIVNTEPLHAKAAVVVLKKLGIEIDLETSLAKFYGMTDIAVLRICCPTMSEKEIYQTIEEKNKILIDIFNNLNHIEKMKYVTPGFFDFVSLLKSKNIKIGVVSASEDPVVDSTLATFKIDSLLDIRMGRAQTHLTKPHPDPYLEGMKRLDCKSSETLIFEDSPTGLTSAKATNSDVIRITEFAHTPEILHHHELKNFIALIN